MNHHIYILKCSDERLYTGYTTDLERRVLEHNSSDKGAKYTRGRRPVELVYTEECASRSEAQRREAKIKKMTRSQKLALIENQLS
jgi:putative endonuclease